MTNTAGSEFSPDWQPLTIPPTATNDPNVTTAFNTPVTINVLANDTADPYGPLNPASVTVVSAPANGTTSVNSTTGAITYTPNTGFAGTDSFTYRVCSSASATLCDTAIVTITVSAGPVIPGLPKTGGEVSSSQNWLTLAAATATGLSLFSVRQFTKSAVNKLGTKRGSM